MKRWVLIPLDVWNEMTMHVWNEITWAFSGVPPTKTNSPYWSRSGLSRTFPVPTHAFDSVAGLFLRQVSLLQPNKRWFQSFWDIIRILSLTICLRRSSAIPANQIHSEERRCLVGLGKTPEPHFRLQLGMIPQLCFSIGQLSSPARP